MTASIDSTLAYRLAAGVDLSIDGDAELVDAVRLAMPRLFRSGEGFEGQPHWRLQLEREGTTGAGLSSRSGLRPDQQETRTDTGRVVLSARDLCQIFTRGPAGLGVLLHVAIAGILRRQSMLQIHAATLSRSDGASALLFIGPSGAGKTTVTMNLARRGWGFLSDDSVVLSESDGKFQARPLRSHFRVGREGQAEKQILDPEPEFPGQRLSSTAIGGLVFVEQSGAPNSRLTPLLREDAFARLPAAASAFGVSEEARWQLGFIARLSRLPAFTLSVGRDVLSGDDKLERLLCDLPAEARAA